MKNYEELSSVYTHNSELYTDVQWKATTCEVAIKI